MRYLFLFFMFSTAQATTGSVVGLGAGKSLVIKNSVATKIITINGTYQIADGGQITVAIQPSGLRCTVTNPYGIIQSANITNANIICVPLVSARVTWTPPTQNTDGTILTDLTAYILYYGIDPTLAVYTSRILPASAVSTTVNNLVANNTYYFAIASVSASGGTGPRSNIASVVK